MYCVFLPQTDCIHENLSSSKDHSQTAASMSVIALHIGILKEILSKPQVDFHEVGLALISACLALQVGQEVVTILIKFNTIFEHIGRNIVMQEKLIITIIVPSIH